VCIFKGEKTMKRLRRLGRYLIACGLAFTLVACASTPPAAPFKKVQSVEELLSKLKKAFDTGAITDPDFYAKELGYPLIGPLTYSPDSVFDTKREQYIRLNEGEVKDTLLPVRTGLTKDGEQFLYMEFRTSHLGCFDFEKVLKIWGNANFKRVPDTALHRTGATNPPLFYEATKQTGNARRIARISIGSKDSCLDDLSVTEFFKGQPK
jgi:hypothetical protein